MIERKKIAIIGGGASGIISGYLLNENHDITLYEKESILGGNVRTLNKNIKGINLPQNVNIENGVLGFSQNYYPKFHKLLHHLGTPYYSHKPSISLFNNDQFFPAKTTSYLNLKSIGALLSQANYRKELKSLIRDKKSFSDLLNTLNAENQCFSDYFNLNGLYQNYLQALFMLSFSTTFHQVPHLPQSLLNNYLLSLPNSTWSFIKGGVYSYMETLHKKSNMNIICDAKHLKVSRNEKQSFIHLNGEKYAFDAVIIAATPGSIKNILLDMSAIETKIFMDWFDQSFNTTAHTDLSLYGKFHHVKKTPMDLFVHPTLNKFGYNTYQNNGYQLNPKTPYSFAYNLDEWINKEKIIHQASHVVPTYNKKHEDKVKSIQSINGQNNTFFVGAYLGNGLHEGAVESAMDVAFKLGGKMI